MTYTYDDIVTAKDILTGRVKKEDIIGKKGWFFDCIPQDMSLNVIEGDSKYYCLGHVELNWKCPFFADDGDGGTWTYFLPEKEESAPIPRFKIGDRVKIVKEWIGFEGRNIPTIGKTGRIEEINKYGHIRVVLDSDGDFWWYSPDSVELIEDEEPEICGSAIEEGPFECKEKSYEDRQAEWVKANNVKVGDKVRILRAYDECDESAHDFYISMTESMKSLIGKVVTVRCKDSDAICLWNEDKSDWWAWPYFVLEKVNEPAYIPFDLSSEEDRDALRDKWVKSTNPDVFHEFKISQFVRMNDDHQTIYVKAGTTRYSGNDLFYDYIFADGSPVGRRKEE